MIHVNACLMSSNLIGASYDDETLLMVCHFSPQLDVCTTYHYHDVPIEWWWTFVAYPSKGSFVNKYLEPRFHGIRVDDVPVIATKYLNRQGLVESLILSLEDLRKQKTVK